MIKSVRLISVILVAVTVMLFTSVFQAGAVNPKVSELGNKHNLSGPNLTVAYRATNDATNNPRGQEICIFCHTPHNANVEGQAPLWNRAFSSVTFQRYTSTTLHIRHITNAQYGEGAQPNGSSRLCLSCHDGVSKLGVIYNGPEIPMAGADVITGLASFSNKLATGHHPISFVYLTGFNAKATPQTGTIHAELPASYRFLPISSSYKVKLFDTKRNGNGWMQCTTCHDPHQNQSVETGPSTCYDVNGILGACDTITYTRKVAPFWNYHGTNTTATQDTGTVCKVCHALAAPGTYSPWPKN